MDGLMKRTLSAKKILSSLAALFILSTTFILAAPAQADSSPNGLTSMGTRAFNDLTRCISTKQKLDVYYLVDQSNSLPLTDPQAARAGILASSLKELAGFNSSIQVNYAVGFFGTTFDAWRPFTPVNAANIASDAASFASEVAQRDKQNDTNWLLGLNGATDLLAKQEQSSHACQALIWLTDGGLWLSQNGGNTIDQAAVDAATNTLCDTTFDNFRKNNVSVFGVLLDNTQALQTIYKNNPVYYGQNDRGMALMRPLIEGSGATLPGQQSTTCGSPILPNYSAGALLIAKDPIALALQFLVLGAQTQGGTSTNLPPGNPTSFDIEQGIRKFQLVTTSVHWTLTAPDGTAYNSGTTAIPVSLQNGFQQITVSGSQLKQGTWKFAFDTNEPVTNQLFLYSGLSIALDPDQYIGGSKTYISGQVVVDGSSGPVDLKVYRTHSFHISQVTSSGTAIPISNVTLTNDGHFSAPFNLTTNQTNLEIRLELDLSTINGQNLAPVSISKFLTVVIPSNYPTIDSPIVLSPLHGPNGVAKGVITVHGPVNGSGQLCLTGSSPYGITIQRDSIERSASYSWLISGTDSSHCISVNQGETKSLTVQVKNPQKADANVIAVVPLKFISAQNQTPFNLSAPIDFQTSLIRAGRGVVKILLFLLGIGIPLLFLWILNKFSSKFIFGTGMQRAVYQVRVDSTVGIRDRNGEKIEPIADDFVFIPQQPDTNFYKDAIGTLRARVPWNPLREPWYEIEATAGTRLVTIPGTSIRNNKRQNLRFASGQIARTQADMGKFWALSIPEKELITPKSGSEVLGTLVIYKRNKLGIKTHHSDRVAEVVATAGTWARITEIKQAPVGEIKPTKELKAKRVKADKSQNQNQQNATITLPTTAGGPPPMPGGSSPLPPPPPISGGSQ